MKRKRKKHLSMRFRKDDPTHNVIVAVNRWVKAKGGSVVVIGGLEVQTWPGEAAFKFKVAVNCVGRAPKQPDELEQKAKTQSVR